MTLEYLINGITIDVDQANFIKGDPISVFPKRFELNDHMYGIYRRGDDIAYTGDFIPIWMYSLIPYCGKTIMYIKPTNTPEEFCNYCGLKPSELVDLVVKGDVVPILANEFKDYKDDVFGEFFSILKKERFELIRAQLYEDLLISSNLNVEPYMAFKCEVEKREKKYRDIIKKSNKNNVDEYNQEVSRGLAPPLNKLPHFIAEKVVWQELDGHSDNVAKIEPSNLTTPLHAYINARYWHYIVVPEFYARGGITWLSHGEDYQINSRKLNWALIHLQG